MLSVSDGVLAQIDADYNSIGKIQYICSETDIDILKTEYTENVYMEMIVQAENYGQFVQKITDAFSGKISVVKIQQQKFSKIMGKDSNISQKEVLKTEKFNLYCKCDVKINKKYGTDSA